MSWTFTSRPEEFPEAAEAWLRADPTRNTVPLTVLNRLRHGLWAEDATLGWLTAGGEVRGAVVHTPPYPVLLGDIPLGSVAALAEALRGRPISGVSGPKEQAEAFAATGGRAESGRVAQRLYRLGDLRPHSSTGAPRPADEADAGWVASWMRDFMAEAEPENAGGDFLPQMRHRIAQGEMVLWADAGRPVAMAGFSRPISGMSRIGPVYTPSGSRGRGYGSAVTHAATRAAQEAGAGLLLLFTDLANPTSNSIYQNLGYRPVSDYASIAFAPPA
ncbi:N-acetyltransferase [Sphaerisporangium siamense]|uniref:GNAT superfamily N-acetyltransferase n=1 Tax=Sphaerisporangium siamense TaxID=795645 RepID=A0A7W7D9W7_9ACTN|nr:GNAT family N-acetyltransferase [Sphaerisporangium siamense]MBB4702080.1 GNAT superfamily N-acetyltransferase [Sphaerisporangium siamense]GII87229.1 N-acetyltransferase [Sphaerisporangium siamense]